MENAEQKKEHRIPSIFSVGIFRFAAWIVLLVSLVQRQQGMIILALLVLLLVNGAKLWSKFGLVKLQAELTADRLKLFPGEKVIIGARVENRKLLPVWLQLILSVTGMQDEHTGDSLLMKESGLLWYEQISWQWELVAKQRGYHQLGPLVCNTGDLFGFFLSRNDFKNSLYLTVYPRILPVRDFTVQLREFFGYAGGNASQWHC